MGVFFVQKKNGSIRLIIDARITNQRFRTPPGVPLSSAEAFADVECEEGQPVYISTTDVQNCFYRMRMDPELSEYFSLPAVLAGSVGVSEVEGVPVAQAEEIHHCFCCLPMGFSWSLFLHSPPTQVSRGARRR